MRVTAALCPDLRLDHVDASGAEGFDAVVDVHHALALSHVQHDVQHDVAAGASGAHAATHGNVLLFYTFTLSNHSRVINLNGHEVSHRGSRTRPLGL